MIWCICFLLVVLILFRTALLLIRSTRKFKSVLAFIYVLLAAYIIYLPVFVNELSITGRLFGNILNTMRMVTLDASFLDFYNAIYKAIGVEVFANIYIIAIGLMHILVPVFAVITAYDCIVNFLSYLKIKGTNLRAKDLYIFSEMNEYSIGFALDISNKLGKKAEFIFANTLDDKTNRTRFVSRLSHFTLTSDRIDSLELSIKKKKKVFFLSVSEDNDENINNTIRLAEKYTKLSKELQRQVKIFLYSDDKETETVIDSINKGILEIGLLDKARLSVYSLFDENPLYESIEDFHEISLLICGMDRVGEEALKAALWLGQLVDTKLIINVFDKKAQRKKSALMLQCPEMFSEDYNINFYDTDMDTIEFRENLDKYCADTTYVVVCGEDDEENISRALFLRRYFLKVELNDEKIPVVACYINNYEKTDVVKNLKTPEAREDRKINYEIVPFGGAQSFYTYDAIMNNNIEKLSINVHLAYESIFSPDGKIDYEAAMESYNAFEVNKRSNRANVLHIRYKLWMLGLDYTEDEDAVEVDLNDYLSAEMLEKLTVAEHDRWMAFLRTEGWITATVPQVKTYQKNGLSRGRHNCPLLKMHPYICAFDDLKEVSDALNLPDATEYDRQLITRIPEILKNKAVNDCNYKIIKRSR